MKYSIIKGNLFQALFFEGGFIIMSNIGNVLTSMEVAQMVDKKHYDLLKDIRRYTSQLGEGKISVSDFFSESTYTTEQNKTVTCYLVTKKGCEFIAHKLTGQKGGQNKNTS